MCGELRRLRAGAVMGTHKRIYRTYWRSTYPCKGTGQPAVLFGPARAETEKFPDSGGTKIMTEESATKAPDDVAPVTYKYPRRAVMHVAMPIVHDLLGLPDDVEVLHVAPGHHGLSLAVVLSSPDIPEVPPHCTPWEVNPTYERTEDGRARLVSTGIDELTGGK
ncbi:hypothetical protein GCM10027258_62770 [Amycolatopsis stemonae]